MLPLESGKLIRSTYFPLIENRRQRVDGKLDVRKYRETSRFITFSRLRNRSRNECPLKKKGCFYERPCALIRLSRSRSFFIPISPGYKGLNRWLVLSAGYGRVDALRIVAARHRASVRGHATCSLNASYTRMRLVSCSTSPRRASFSRSLLEHNGIAFPLFAAREEREVKLSSSLDRGTVNQPCPLSF